MLSENDHRSLGKRLDLFHLQDDASGMVFWHQRGLLVYRLLEARVRRLLEAGGYQEVRTPQLFDQSLWESSGHWQHFRAGMFVLGEDGHASGLKPVNCPGHIRMFEQMRPSYRDLPLRLAEFGLVHRNEASGALQGLFRLRQFTQDDGHIFCSEAQVVTEVEAFCRALQSFYGDFGFEEVEVAFSSRPADRAGSDELWDRAEEALLSAARGAGLACRMQPGEGAFYGPKLEFVLKDRLGRAWQCGTIQLDLVLPERFDLSFGDAGGIRRRPVMLHRAIFGSVERFLAVLLEHHDGALPLWLAPEQVRVLPVGSEARAYAEGLRRSLAERGVRCGIDERPESLSRRIVAAHEQGVPLMAVVGSREAQDGSVCLRRRDGSRSELSWNDAVAECVQAAAMPA